MTQECICCHKTKDIKLFRTRNKTCKLCQWFKKHRIIVPDKWSEEEVKTVIEMIHDNHTSYINDIAWKIGKTIPEIVFLLKDTLKLSNIRNQKIRIKQKCNMCGKEYETFICKYDTNSFCSHKCYSKFRSIYYVGEKASVYTKVECCCDNCGKTLFVARNRMDNKNSEMISHNFCDTKCYGEFRKKYYVGNKLYNTGIHLTDEQKEQCRINTVKCYEEGKITRNTKPQRIVNDILKELNISYQNEKNYKYYSVDNYLSDNNLIIEVMGDYFHANPTIYTKINEMQKKDIARDKRKHTYINKYYNIEILYLWENDLLHEREKCKQLIVEYIKGNGVISNYNSFNYNLNDGVLFLNPKITNPYFI